MYGPNSHRDTGGFYGRSGLNSWWSVPWFVGDDFNVVRFPSERLGSNYFTAAMQEFPILFRDRTSLICHCKGELLLGQILKKLLRKLGWKNSCSLQIGRISFQQFLKDGCPGYARIIFQLSLRVDLFREGVGHLHLRICGLRMRVLWIGVGLGGNPISFKVLRVLFWPIN